LYPMPCLPNAPLQNKCAKLELGRTSIGSSQDFLEDIPIAGSGSMPTFFIEFSHGSSLSTKNY
ncbi:hypothetical protein, partial [Nostoc sp. 2RC]|uniref:hypothetical protein n=1 Tax=Nostoc sp. 2RC TaxID=2485484 RepID=UPI001C890ABE